MLRLQTENISKSLYHIGGNRFFKYFYVKNHYFNIIWHKLDYFNAIFFNIFQGG